VIPVHPFDLEDAAGALDRALATPLDERATMAKQLRALAIARTPADWLADLIVHAE
jgi:trehalose-6-phosphate synthase